ncbi:M20/M25/M40 family metallo-hydrolase [Sphingomicrobium nitratireducens]|uniref:M20/M25/M40 family metallo-hydrolase n=1 Tax=Sphingomicrobium nitratireducens TaxID=2964666 RepID=UPI00223F1128|nr:M20/M25/M40 family metallo-hydrolase [Sphingomicrobium nitratireducens]
MKFRLTAGCALALSATPLLAAEPDVASIDRVRADVEFLANDLLEGREAGTRGHEIAALYVASRFKALGLEPAGDEGTYFQQVTLRAATLVPEQSSVVLTRGGKARTLPANLLRPRPSLSATDVTMEGELVFAGYGLDAPSLGIDDYEGLDVKGKIVVVLEGAPPGLPADIKSHLDKSRSDMAAAHGAIGYIAVSTSAADRARRFYEMGETYPSSSWISPDGSTGALADGLKLRVSISPEGAETLFEGSDVSLDKLYDLARGDAAQLPRFALPGTLKAHAVSTWDDFTSPNVVARLPGTDPALADEHVAIVAHLDHLGTSEGDHGHGGYGRLGDKETKDKVYNGALDNAAGVAGMLEAARMFVEGEGPQQRSMLFMAVTAEEKGLLGAGYFADNPTVPVEDIIGVISSDMPVPLYDFGDIVAFGTEHNTLSETIAAAAGTLGVSLSPDPMPEQSIFTRSDHYQFARKGIPATLLFTGYGNGGQEIWADFFSRCYHKQCDDLSLPIKWDMLARFATINYRIANMLADANGRPLWYADSPMSEMLAPGAARAKRP